MNNIEIFDLLIKHILKIYDENDVEVLYSRITYKYEKRMYSAVKSIVLYLDNVALTRSLVRSYKVLYLCRCNREHKILLLKYILKKRLYCINCLLDRSFNIYVEANKKGKKKKQKAIPKSFDEYDVKFKEDYIKKHLSIDEFYKFLPYIYKINNTIISTQNISNIKYFYAEHINNLFKFTAKVSFNNGETKETIKEVYLKCNTCGRIFKIHFNNIRLLDLSNILCVKCKCTNTTYPIRKYNNTDVTYQSGPEKVFLDLCFSNNILVENGQCINYYFNNRNRVYITDFFLPKLKYIIEIKAKNKFYKDDVKSGKLTAKNNAAEQFASINNYKFKMVFDYELDDFFQLLLNERDSLES